MKMRYAMIVAMLFATPAFAGKAAAPPPKSVWCPPTPCCAGGGGKAASRIEALEEKAALDAIGAQWWR